MQQDVSPHRRRWPLILIILIPVVVGVWSGTWYYAADRAESLIAGWREREAKAGRIHTCSSQTVSGFPFRFEIRCSDPGLELKSVQPPLSIKAKDILITARIWRPTRLTSEIVGPLTIAEPGQSATITANWRRARTEVRGLPTSPEQVTIVLDQPVVERTAGADTQRLFNSERLEVSGRMLGGSALSNPVIEIALKLAAGAAPTLYPVTATALDADITSVLRGLKDFRPKPWPDRFREIQAAGGRIEITQARVKHGQTIATASGALALSPAGRPDGELRLTVANLINLIYLLPALGLDGRSPQGVNESLDNAADKLDRIAPRLGDIARHNAAPALVAGLFAFAGALATGYIGQPAEIEGRRAITFPLRFNDGAVALGSIPLGQIEPLF